MAQYGLQLIEASTKCQTDEVDELISKQASAGAKLDLPDEVSQSAVEHG